MLTDALQQAASAQALTHALSCSGDGEDDVLPLEVVEHIA